MPSAPRILISTGELSGDYHASNLVKEIRKQAPDAVFFGIGSHNMKSAGVELLYDSTDWGGIGVFSGLIKAPEISRIGRKIIREIPGLDLDLIIVVDYRVFHTGILNAIRHLDIKKLYYFAPIKWPGFEPYRLGLLYANLLESLKHINPLLGRQTKNRFDNLSDLADKLILAYPLSIEEYKKAGADVEFLGHPLMNVVFATKSKEQVRSELGLNDKSRLIGILPGSREHELRLHLPVLKKVISGLRSNFDDLHFYIPIAHPDHKNKILYYLGDESKDIKFVDGDDYDILNASDLVLSKTGTSVQILMALGVPTVAFYTIVSSLWYNISIRLFVRFDHIAFPNVLAGKRIIPEFIQDDFKFEKILESAIKLLEDDKAREEMSSELLKIRDQLYRPDALEKAASIALEMATNKN